MSCLRGARPPPKAPPPMPLNAGPGQGLTPMTSMAVLVKRMQGFSGLRFKAAGGRAADTLQHATSGLNNTQSRSCKNSAMLKLPVDVVNIVGSWPCCWCWCCCCYFCSFWCSCRLRVSRRGSAGGREVTSAPKAKTCSPLLAPKCSCSSGWLMACCNA